MLLCAEAGLFLDMLGFCHGVEGVFSLVALRVYCS